MLAGVNIDPQESVFQGGQTRLEDQDSPAIPCHSKAGTDVGLDVRIFVNFEFFVVDCFIRIAFDPSIHGITKKARATKNTKIGRRSRRNALLCNGMGGREVLAVKPVSQSLVFSHSTTEGDESNRHRHQPPLFVLG